MLTLGHLTPPQTGWLPGTATIAQAVALLRERGLSSLVVVDDSAVQGIVTERDILRALRRHQPPEGPVSALMTTPVLTVPADQDYRSAYQLALRHGVRHLVVMGAAGQLLGTVSESDIRRHLGQDFFSNLSSVAGLMQTKFPALAPDARLEEAFAAMDDSRSGCVVVVDAGRPAGILTERDVVRLFLEDCGNTPVAAVMTQPVRTIDCRTTLAAAARTMLSAAIRHLVVVDAQGCGIGLLNEHDLLRPLELDLLQTALGEQELLARERDAANERLRLVSEAIHDGIWDYDVSTGEGYLNHRFYEMLGLAPGAMPATVAAYMERVHPDDRDRLVAVQAASFAADSRPYEAEYRLRHADGSWLWVQSRGRVVARDATGQPRRRIGTVTDISQRKAAEQALQARERYQRALLDNFPFFVWLKDTDSRFLAVNKQFSDALGWPSPELLTGKTDFDVSPPDLAERYRADDRAVMASGERRSVEEMVVDHQVRTWSETYKAPVVGSDGTLFGTVGFARNISAKKRTEEGILLRNAALAGLIRGERLGGVLDLIVLALETELPGWNCAIMIASGDGQHLQHGAAPRLPEAFVAAIDGIAIGTGSGPGAAAPGHRVVVDDVAHHPDWAHHQHLARLGGFSAFWSDPVMGPDGEVLGTVRGYHPTPRAPSADEVECLARVSQFSALVLSHQRHAERLQASQNTFRGIFDGISEALLILGSDGIFLDVNAGAEALFGHPRATLIGQTPEFVMAPDLNGPGAMPQCAPAAGNGTPETGEFWARDAGGRTFPAEIRVQSGTYFGRQVLILAIQDITGRHQAAQRLEIDHDLAEALASGRTRDEVLGIILDTGLRFPEISAGGIYWRSASGAYRLAAHRGLSAAFVAAVTDVAADSPQAAVIRGGRLVLGSDDDGSDPQRPQLLSPRLRAEGLRCLLVLPIVVAGEPLACLNLASRRSAHLSPATLAALTSLGNKFGETLLRLQAQENALVLQENLSVLFNTISDILLIFDDTGRVVHHNRAAAEQLGLTGPELHTRSLATLHPAGSEEALQRLHTELALRGRSLCPLPLLRADGSLLPVETQAAKGYWNGKPALFGIARDIRERLAAQESLRLAASVFANAHEGIMITDPRGILLEVNAAFSELTGYSRDEALGRPADLLRSGHHSPEFFADLWTQIGQTGFWQGEIWNRKKSGEITVVHMTISTVRNPAGAVSHYVGIFSDITLIKEHQQRLEHLAHFDPLTQLPNRMLLADRMQQSMAQAERGGKLLAVCYLDLDGFKPVNDAHGHAIGDRLLVEVAQRLKACTRAGDTVARLGGDEFVLLFSELEDLRECDRAISRIITTVATPFVIAEGNISISASIGVTLYPLDGSDSDTLMRHADQAMYAAKQAGRNRYHLFDPENDRRARARNDEIGRIREGLAQGEFVLHFQPRVDMRLGRVLGAEALIRWQHPERGLLPPREFLPAVEGHDFAIELGDWVLGEALRQAAVWQDRDLSLVVSVNIAGNHLQAPGFTQRLGELLERFPQLPANRLELEILETTALEDMAQVSQVFTRCRQLGVSFALDDFGTGYSSLTYFRRLPADVLKIDQSFVRDMLDDPDDLAIVEGVIGLTRAFQRKVIAEGVESIQHGVILLQLGCDQAQGFGIARPMPAAAIPDWIAGFRPDPLWSSSASFQWSREDLPMLVAEIDHNRWQQSLENFLDGTSPAPPTADHRHCRFGRWYDGPARQRYAHYASYAALDPLHARIHALGEALIAAHQAGEDASNTARRAELRRLSAQLTEQLQFLQAETLLAQQDIRALDF